MRVHCHVQEVRHGQVVKETDDVRFAVTSYWPEEAAAPQLLELARELGVPIEGPHTDDIFLLEALGENAGRPGFADAEPCLPSRFLTDGDTVSFGEISFGVRHCPGHTPGHVVFVLQAAKVAFVGDVLFRGSIGRTDLPRGNHAQLIRSITQRLWPLGDDMQFVPGHGPASTFGWERKTNPFVSDLALGQN